MQKSGETNDEVFRVVAGKPGIISVVFMGFATSAATLCAIALLIGAANVYFYDRNMKMVLFLLIGCIFAGGFAAVFASLFKKFFEHRRHPDKCYLEIKDSEFIYRFGDELTVIPLEKINNVTTVKEHTPDSPTTHYLVIKYNDERGNDRELYILISDFKALCDLGSPREVIAEEVEARKRKLRQE